MVSMKSEIESPLNCFFQVGGIKEKVLAAHRAGLKRVILPRRNEKVRKGLGSLCQALRLYSGDVLNEQSENKTRATWQRGPVAAAPVSPQPPRVFLFLNDFSLSPLSRNEKVRKGLS